MAQTVPVRPKQRSSGTGAPATTDLLVGELGVNTYDGTMFMNYTPGGGAQTILRFATTLDLANYAPLASPAFTGTPSMPTGTTGTTQAANDSSTKLATTAFVVGQAGTATPVINGTGAVGTSLLYARQDHVHPSDTSRAPTASPTFTGTITFPSTTVPGFLTPIQTKTAAYTAVQGDNNSTIVVNSSSSLAMTLPTLAAGTTITFVQRGTGKVTWTASGTTITVYPSGSTGSAGQGAQFTAVWDTTTTILIGGAVS